MTKKHVVITATKEMPVDIQTLQRSLGENYELEIVPLPYGDMSLAEREAYWRRIAEADALFVRTGVIPYELIGQCRNLKIISLHGSSVDQVDIKAATEAGIYVTNVPGGNAQAVAELAFALMLAAMRQILRAHQYVTQGQWDAARALGREVSGKRLGLVGVGDVAERVARMAQAFDMEVVYWDIEARTLELAQSVTREELFSTSDLVSIHVELSNATRALIDRRQFALMKPDAWLVNTSRRAVINMSDLLQAIHEGWFAGVAFDMYEQEPLPSNSPLFALPNVILTPHLAGSSRESLVRLAEVAANDIKAALTGQKPYNAVNQPWGL